MPNVTYLELDLDTSIFGVFGQSLSSSKIHTLRIRNALPIVREAENEDTNVLRSFSSLQSLELIRVSAKTLLDRFTVSSGGKFPNRKPSMGSIIDSNGLPPAVLHAKSKGSEDSLEAVWPKLHTISLDTMLADDVVSLISFITYHKGIRSLNLSYLAMRHLRFLRRKGNTVITSPPIILSGRGSPFEEDKDIGTADVEEWLSVMVHLDLMEDTLDLESLLPSTKEVPLVQLP
ncbi:hypothetical protein JR316_0007767 [Psilocybe cubensis]|uniref:Uncharacterized protein n=2 Tax=Psilocybe cubensis TaxID=181762 RepID=A0A8H7XUX7_PSICU|nr:hypothetical protein JR316_0007767 [Psilocybe cubensis]KAH9479181.1 hypothetical protein JR316_0007767 [Psilocybe cubensis]